MSSLPIRTYPSKRDGWLVAVIWFGVVEIVGASILLITLAGAAPYYRFFLPAFLLAVAGFMLKILYGTSYTFADDLLIVRSGLLRWKVPLAAIREVQPTHNVLSSPACSLDRLKVKYQRRWIMISPEDKAGFLRDLVARVPGLVLEGESVRRSPEPGSAVLASALGG